MASSMPEFRRECHRRAARVLHALNADVLTRAACYFADGTRIAMALGEYRESADIDFLCANMSGYRLLRNTIRQNTLGSILREPLPLLREVRADRYGIRTFLDIDGQPLKFEIVAEGRIPLVAAADSATRVPELDEVSCFAEKFLANADRWADPAIHGRDLVDLAFMAKGWGYETAQSGLVRAHRAYGDVALDALAGAARKMEDDPEHRRRCTHALGVSDGRTLREGLRTLHRLSSDYRESVRMAPPQGDRGTEPRPP